jgi:hypothetical protein
VVVVCGVWCVNLLWCVVCESYCGVCGVGVGVEVLVLVLVGCF